MKSCSSGEQQAEFRLNTVLALSALQMEKYVAKNGMTVLTGPIYARLPRNSHPLRRRRRRDADALFPHRFHCVRERLRDNPVVSSLGVLWRRRAALEAHQRICAYRRGLDRLPESSDRSWL